MFCLNDTMRYFLCPGKTDMRKGINSLCGLVHDKMGYDVYSLARIKSLDNNKAIACESRSFVHKKGDVHFDTPP